MMTIINLLHTAILVSDLTKAEDFYSNILGLRKIKRALKYPGIWYQIGDCQLHLIEDTTLKKKVINEEKWGRNYHFALGVNDLESLKTHLEKNGYPTQMSASGRAALFTQDFDGNIIEITQI